MSQSSTEKLKTYLTHLPPQAQALLMREFERAIARGGGEVAVANFVLGELRKIARGVDASEAPRAADASRLLFQPLEPFLIDGKATPRPGQIRRSSLLPVWNWLSREGAADAAQQFIAALGGADSGMGEIERQVRQFQNAATVALMQVASLPAGVERQRTIIKIGPAQIGDDLLPIANALQAADALRTFEGRLPRHIPNFADAQLANVVSLLDVPALQAPQTLPFALTLAMQRLAAPWQIIRLPLKLAASDEESRVAGVPSSVAVTMILHDLAEMAAELQANIRRGQFELVAEHLKSVHDGVRGLRTELDLRSDSVWSRQLAAIRAQVSSAVQSELNAVPGRVRRLLRQRSEKDISPGMTLDAIDVDETVALTDFVALCRNYASELAINEVTLRTHSELQQYVERSTEALVQALRKSDPKTRPYLQAQVKAAIRFCRTLFGDDYAALMNRSAEHAVLAERKPLAS